MRASLISSSASSSMITVPLIRACGCRNMPVLAAQTINPALRGRLRRAWSAFCSWKQHVRSESRVPVPRLLLHGLFVSLVVACLDHPGDALYWFSAAVLFRIGFQGREML
eukprot:13105242-Heterocapsa_arctica.AAC.1